MTDGRCATCQFWDNAEHLRYDFYDSDYGYCKRLSDYRDWVPDEVEYIQQPTGSDAWWHPRIDTHKTFGCVLFERKE
jgi:hypothetical protein